MTRRRQTGGLIGAIPIDLAAAALGRKTGRSIILRPEGCYRGFARNPLLWQSRLLSPFARNTPLSEVPMETDPPFVHRIRLRGPWEFVWSASEDGTFHERSGTLSFPATWHEVPGDRRGVVRFSRRFNRPTGIDHGERVWLEVSVSRLSSVSLNEQPLGVVRTGVVRFDVTDRLVLHCKVELEIDRTSNTDDDLIAEVALVVESSV